MAPMLTTLFANLELFYLLVWIAVCGFSVASRHCDYIVSAFLLGAMYFAGQWPMWSDPTALLWFHVGLYFIMMAAFRDEKPQKLLRKLMLAMILTDASWTMISGGLFYYQSILNVIFLLMSITTIVGSYQERKSHPPQRRRDLKRRHEYSSNITDIGIQTRDPAKRARSGETA